jgi:dynamin-binding protein
MIKFARFLKIYSDYLKNLRATQSKVNSLEENPIVKSIEKDLSTENKIITFSDLLVKPFQRPLKYHLILRDYWSKLGKEHRDYHKIEEAIREFESVN